MILFLFLPAGFLTKKLQTPNSLVSNFKIRSLSLYFNLLITIADVETTIIL